MRVSLYLFKKSTLYPLRRTVPQVTAFFRDMFIHTHHVEYAVLIEIVSYVLAGLFLRELFIYELYQHILRITEYTVYRIKLKGCYNMWNCKYIQDIIERFLPPKAKIVLLETPYKRPAVGVVDLDGDCQVELIGTYYWQGFNCWE